MKLWRLWCHHSWCWALLYVHPSKSSRMRTDQLLLDSLTCSTLFEFGLKAPKNCLKVCEGVDGWACVIVLVGTRPKTVPHNQRDAEMSCAAASNSTSRCVLIKTVKVVKTLLVKLSRIQILKVKTFRDTMTKGSKPLRNTPYRTNTNSDKSKVVPQWDCNQI